MIYSAPILYKVRPKTRRGYVQLSCYQKRGAGSGELHKLEVLNYFLQPNKCSIFAEYWNLKTSDLISFRDTNLIIDLSLRKMSIVKTLFVVLKWNQAGLINLHVEGIRIFMALNSIAYFWGRTCNKHTKQFCLRSHL